MSILDSILKNLPDEDDWLEKALDQLDDLVGGLEDGTVKEGSEKIVDVLKNNKADIADLTRSSFVLFVSYVAADKTDDAVLTYLRKDATVDELIAGMLRDAAAIVKAKERREALKASALKLIKLITVEGAKKLLPLLLLAL